MAVEFWTMGRGTTSAGNQFLIGEDKSVNLK